MTAGIMKNAGPQRHVEQQAVLLRLHSAIVRPVESPARALARLSQRSCRDTRSLRLPKPQRLASPDPGRAIARTLRWATDNCPAVAMRMHVRTHNRHAR